MCLYLSFYIPAARDGHFCCFSVLAAVNRAAVKGRVRGYLRISVLSLYQLRSAVARLSGDSVFLSLRSLCSADVC